MAPALLAISFSSGGSYKENPSRISPAETLRNGRTNLKEDMDRLQIEELRSRNKQLEQQLKESQRHEKELRAQLEEMRIRLSTVEEAEERLCSQLGDLEAEAVEEAQSYNREFNSLQQRLRETENLLLAARAGLQRHR
eukprot:Gb_25238 [translate_table: standard]